jgi:hypothetical protein
MVPGAADTPDDGPREASALKPFACVSCYGLAAAALAVGLYHAPAPDWSVVVLVTALACIGAYLAIGGRLKLSVGKEGVSATLEEEIPDAILEGADVFTAEGTSGAELAENDLDAFDAGGLGSGGGDEVATEPVGGTAAQMALPDAAPAAKPPRPIPATCTDLYLTHKAWPVAGGPGSKQWYAVRIALEADCEELLDTCERVTYRLHDTFPKPVVATRARDKEFELWIRCWGEFTVRAIVERRGAPPVPLTRYLDLPGRPED